ncbi:hypothetical protein [Aquibium sp. ELW1220]|uniref:LEM-3-like GIY-YIG domain-containing protein n=1 Tax=Aquibium sp. ELW1220 TaxID=2976766 RepID=UPI0025AF39FF|nr:hypothetical protein [Aquibium sp. ELW1220]MDN2581397.1 hypothetical protein [Aquibium sp. ELW1220]
MFPVLYGGLDGDAQSHSLGDCMAYGYWPMFIVDACTVGLDSAGTIREDLRGLVQAFPSEITEQLGYYVYRLIDPRNGETFYVGKGRGNRVFHHVNANLKQSELADEEDELTIKMKRVHEILSEGLQVIHVIQRHGLTEKEALHVEGALIDAFPGLTNVQSGYGNSDKGAMHADAIIRKYAAQRLEPHHRIVFLTIRRNFLADRGPYEGCRGVWRMSRSRAERAELVMPVTEGVVVGVFVPERWIDATVADFPAHITEDLPGRIGFDGHPADKAIRDLYIGKRLPADLETGTQNPVRYSYS